MERLIDKFLTLLLLMAERITGKCPSPADEQTAYEPKVPEDPTPTICILFFWTVTVVTLLSIFRKETV